MAKQPRELADWINRLEAMKRCSTTTELLGRHGEPAHRLKDSGVEIWHYPLGVADGSLYAIHVAVGSDGVPMAYMHLEPTTMPNPVKVRPWWRFW